MTFLPKGEIRNGYCRKCDAELPDGYSCSQFHSTVCPACISLWRKQNHAKKKEKNKLLGPYINIAVRYSGYVATSKQRELVRDLTADDLCDLRDYQGGLCMYTGVELNFGTEESGTHPSLDRFDKSLGYIRGNVGWCSQSFAVNVKKSISLAYIESGMPVIFEAIQNHKCPYKEKTTS